MAEVCTTLCNVAVNLMQVFIKLIVAFNFGRPYLVVRASVEAMPKSELMMLGESITHVLCYWRFGILRGFGWKEILTCVVEHGKYALVFSCCLLLCFIFHSPC